MQDRDAGTEVCSIYFIQCLIVGLIGVDTKPAVKPDLVLFPVAATAGRHRQGASGLDV